MTKRQNKRRFDYLGVILNKSRNLGYFNLGQRTCLQMERAAIFRAIDVIEGSDTVECTPNYTIPRHLEEKCDRVNEDFKINI